MSVQSVQTVCTRDIDLIHNYFCKNISGGIMTRLEAFEKMLADIRKQADYESEQMEKLKADGKEKSATYRQYFSNRMLYKMILDKYRQYGLTE